MADKPAETPVADIKYVRPCDRSPDKDFNDRSDEEKKIICFARATINSTRDKIWRLQDQVEERDKELQTERSLRQAAENHLQTVLQDMYKNPDVNEELRQRLPRANKHDPFKVEKDQAQETEESSIEEQIVVETEEKISSQPRMKPEDMKTLESQIIRDGDVGERRGSADKRTSPAASPKSAKRSLDFTKSSSSKSSKEMSSSETQTPRLERSLTHPFSGLVGQPQAFFSPALGASPFMTVPGSQLNYSYPFMHSPSLYPQSSGLRHSSAPILPTSLPTEEPVSQTLTSSLSHIPQSSTSLSSSTPSQSSTLGATTQDPGMLNTQDSGISMLGSTNGIFSTMRSAGLPSMPGTSMSTSMLPDPFMSSLTQRGGVSPIPGVGLDQNRQLSTLLTELDAQRAESRKLMTKLADREREIETLKVTMKAHEAERRADASETEQAAGLVEEVYAAQRKRDEAMMGRMKVTNQERDDLLSRLRDIESRMDGDRRYSDAASEEDIDEAELDNENISSLISRLESPEATDIEYSSFVNRVEAIKQRQRELTNEEMQVIIEQRDAALAKCHKLEAELLRYQRQEDGGSSDKNLKAKLSAIQQERDMAVAKSRQLDDEVQTLRLYYGLHKSLSQEKSIKQQADHTLDRYQTKLTASSQQLDEVHKENSRLVSQLRAVTIEKKQLAEALDMLKHDKENLQKLVAVLRRKLNGTVQPDESRE